MRPAFGLVMSASVLLVAVLYARQSTSVVDNVQAEPDPGTSSTDPGGWTGAAAAGLDAANPFALMEQNTVNNDATDPNAQAFLAMIRHSEGTDRQADPYAVCYGYSHTIQNFSDHPAITGEWRGVSLAGLGPSYAGKISTAAGAYQIIKPTWLGCRRALSLPDFSPASQDLAALYLIRQAGALDDVKAGNFDAAVAACSSEWASLPGANAPGQAMQRLDSLRVAFVDAGGTLA